MRVILEWSCIILGYMMYCRKCRDIGRRDINGKRIIYWTHLLFVGIGINIFLWYERVFKWNGFVPIAIIGLTLIGIVVYKRYIRDKNIRNKEVSHKQTNYLEQVLESYCHFAIGTTMIIDSIYHIVKGRIDSTIAFGIYEVMLTLMLPIVFIGFLQVRSYVKDSRQYKLSHGEKSEVFTKKLNQIYDKL